MKVFLNLVIISLVFVFFGCSALVLTDNAKGSSSNLKSTAGVDSPNLSTVNATIVNPSFEDATYTTGWTITGTPAKSTLVHAGTGASMKLMSVGATCSQTVTVSPYTWYRLSAWLYHNGHIGVTTNAGTIATVDQGSALWTFTYIDFYTAADTSVTIFAQTPVASDFRADEFSLACENEYVYSHSDSTTDILPHALRTVKVPSQSTLANAITNAQAGDLILLADGSYTTGVSISNKSGVSYNPIVFKAENKGMATISGGSANLTNCDKMVYWGIKFTTPNSVKVYDCTYVKFYRCTFEPSGQTGSTDTSLPYLIFKAITANGSSTKNRVAFCEFKNHLSPGQFIAWSSNSAAPYYASTYDEVEYCYFNTAGPRVSNGMEAVRVGVSSINNLSQYTKIEHNYFYRCNGDPEIISVKSCDNSIKYNTIVESAGSLCLRQGDRNNASYNSILCNSYVESGTGAIAGGIRVYGNDQIITSNYIENCQGSGMTEALVLSGGDIAWNATRTTTGDPQPNNWGNYAEHWQVHGATVTNNRIYNSNTTGNGNGMAIGGLYTGYDPDSCTITGNKVELSDGECFKVVLEGTNTWSSNTGYVHSPSTLVTGGSHTGVATSSTAVTNPNSPETTSTVGVNATFVP